MLTTLPYEMLTEYGWMLSQRIIFSTTLVSSLSWLPCLPCLGIFLGSVGQHRCNILLLICSGTFFSSLTESCCGKILYWWTNRYMTGVLMHVCAWRLQLCSHTLAFCFFVIYIFSWLKRCDLFFLFYLN